MVVVKDNYKALAKSQQEGVPQSWGTDTDYPGDGLIQYEVKNTNLDELSHRTVSLYYILLHIIITNTAIVHPYKLGVLKYLGRRKCLLWYNSQI